MQAFSQRVEIAARRAARRLAARDGGIEGAGVRLPEPLIARPGGHVVAGDSAEHR